MLFIFKIMIKKQKNKNKNKTVVGTKWFIQCTMAVSLKLQIKCFKSFGPVRIHTRSDRYFNLKSQERQNTTLASLQYGKTSSVRPVGKSFLRPVTFHQL